MDKVIYKSIVAKISETRALYDKNRAARSNQQVDPTIQLVEIEGHINKVLKFLALAKIAEPSTVSMLIRRLFIIAKGKKLSDIQAIQQAVVAGKVREMEERKAKKITVKGIRRNFARSDKPRMQRTEVKKEELTDEQRDILRYI